MCNVVYMKGNSCGQCSSCWNEVHVDG